MKAKIALTLAIVGLIGGALALDWRAVGLMFLAWWFDNMLKKLNDRG